MGPGFRQDNSEESKAFLMRGSMDCFALAMTNLAPHARELVGLLDGGEGHALF